MNKGFAPIVIILIAVLIIGAGAGVYVLVSKNRISNGITPASSSTNHVSDTKNLVSAAANPKELLGWWGREGGFPFLAEFTDEYLCIQYSSRSTCADNKRYRVEGDQIFIELESGFQFYGTWKMAGDKLELTTIAGGNEKNLYRKIGPPTSAGKITAPALTRPDIPAEPKANLKLLKVGEGGLCLKHDGGDSIPITNIYVKLNGNSASVQSLEQFPKLASDYIFDAGEFFVFAVMPPAPERFITFHVGDTVEITGPAGPVYLAPTKITKIEPRDEKATVLIGGLATCP